MAHLQLRVRLALGLFVLIVGCGTQAQPPAVPVSRTVPVPATAHQTWQPDAAAGAWKYVLLHHSATESGSVASIDAEHRARRDASGNPWRGIGYHFVIGNGRGMADGQIEPTFRWKDQSAGAHAGEATFNEQGIGICLIGNFDQAPPTEKQLAAARRLVGYLKGEFRIPADRVLKHGDVKATACPGKHFPAQELARVPAVSAAPTVRVSR